MAKIGIIGTGWGARVQVPLFREAGLEVVVIAGRDPARTSAVAHDLGVAPLADWRAVVESDVDLVSVASPPHRHLEMAAEVLRAGKHLLIEKPTALNAEEAESLLDLSRQVPDRVAIVDHELRFLPAWVEARRSIGEIGALRYAEVRYSSPSRGDRRRGWNWWSDASQGGGVWGAVGSHFVDALRYFGFEIEAISAMLRTTIDERSDGHALRPVTSDDFAAVHLRLAGGAAAAMTFSAVASGPDEPTALTLHGDDGAMRLQWEELLFARRGEPFVRIGGTDLAQRPGNSPGGAFGTGTLHLGRALAPAIDKRDLAAIAPAATLEDGLAQQRVLDAGRRSSETGCWVAVRTR